MIYFFQHVEGGSVKIGYTGNVTKRHRELEAYYDCPLISIATMEGDRAEELKIHRRFARSRLGRTEQFRPSLELMKFIGKPIVLDCGTEGAEMMQGSRITAPADLASWLEDVHRKTHIQKAIIVRWALVEWAGRHGHPLPTEL